MHHCIISGPVRLVLEITFAVVHLQLLMLKINFRGCYSRVPTGHPGKPGNPIKMKTLISSSGKRKKNENALKKSLKFSRSTHEIRTEYHYGHCVMPLVQFLSPKSILYCKLLSWKSLILILKSPVKLQIKKCGNPVLGPRPL